jgi:hypothetical protein
LAHAGEAHKIIHDLAISLKQLLASLPNKASWSAMIGCRERTSPADPVELALWLHTLLKALRARLDIAATLHRAHEMPGCVASCTAMIRSRVIVKL